MKKKNEQGITIHPVGKRLCFTCLGCGGPTWTLVLEEGTAMNRVECRRATCRADAMFNDKLTNTSEFSMIQPNPVYGWYRPSRLEARKLNKKWPGVFEYYKQGGLFLKELAIEDSKQN